ncbi:DUF1698 domain-containing protein [Rhizobium rhizogenes]|uniref:DUF1698 domain-containing protein n=1 Tax=Rhizobium rhizogenes TaxID=359 RepID=UPI001572F636|nr:DUF1698 domain-containing protein [Rhizobium rhizogenes]NTI22368.1 DUF1698 domain-containing protein [Rhizobium rhizogenes]QTG05954.1 DUF1698 domain-containing protein [Rhizobium rhizogenes]
MSLILNNTIDAGKEEWIRNEIARHPYWFQKIQLTSTISTPGWSDPVELKLPHFGLPEDMTGMRVLDIGCSEGFFSFEAERRGASEVVAIDSAPESIQRFNVIKHAIGSNANAYLTTVYDLNPRVFGTFDLVMFFGVLYHLRHPLLALEKVLSVCSNRMLFQSSGIFDDIDDRAMIEFHPRGLMSGTKENPLYDGTVFFMPNGAALKGMMEHVGFDNIEFISKNAGWVFHAEVKNKFAGAAPDPATVPGS